MLLFLQLLCDAIDLQCITKAIIANTATVIMLPVTTTEISTVLNPTLRSDVNVVTSDRTVVINVVDVFAVLADSIVSSIVGVF